MNERGQQGRAGLVVNVVERGYEGVKPAIFRTPEDVDAYFGDGDHFGGMVKLALRTGPISSIERDVADPNKVHVTYVAEPELLGMWRAW